MILHLGLKEAGIKSDIAYVRVKHGGHSPEDHGLVVLRSKQGAGWTVDSYNEDFNGVKLRQLLSPKGLVLEALSLRLLDRKSLAFEKPRKLPLSKGSQTREESQKKEAEHSQITSADKKGQQAPKKSPDTER